MTRSPALDRSGSSDFGPRPAAAALARLVGDAGSFARTNWDSTPRHHGAGPFTDLFDAAAVDELVSERGLRTPFLRMARNGRLLPADSFTSGGGIGAQIADQADPDGITRALAEGATLVLQGLHRTWRPVRAFTADLIAELGHPVQVNAYITPPAAQGFAPHYDTHDVFVLQIAGTKQWTLHDPVLERPTPEEPWQNHAAAVARRAGEQPWRTITMSAGDCLYLPRGWIHSAATDTATSIHLTFGIHPITGATAIRSLLTATLADPELRRSLPIAATADQATLTEALQPLQKTAAELLADADVAAAAADLLAGFDRATRPEPIAPLRQLAADSARDTVRLRAGLRCVITVDPSSGRCRLTAGGRYTEVPARYAAALREVTTGSPVRAATLPDIDERAAARLLDHLLRQAIVIPVVD